ncbi:MAG: glycerol kinase, partial [Planctomycetota bacterium]
FALERAKPGASLGPGIVWQDRRTADRCASLRKSQGFAEQVASLTGLVIDPYFSATKIEWMLENEPGLLKRAKAGEICFGTVDSLVMSHLSGEPHFLTDPTNASRTMLFDIDQQVWSEALCENFGVDPSWLAEVRPSCGSFGVAKILGREIPILGVAGDQQAALLGQGATSPGDLKCTFGTGLFLLLNTGARRANAQSQGLLTTLAVGPDGGSCYALEGSIFMGGAILQWMRDKLGILEHAAESERIASSVPDSGGVTLVPAFTGLGAPYWDPDARAAILGLSRGSNRAHIVRAGLEAIALQNVELIELFRQETGIELASMRVDGGAASNNLLMQIQADLGGIEVHRPQNLEATALGAASLAAMQLGLLGPEAGLKIERTFHPDPKVRRDEHLAAWRNAVARIRTA